MILKNGRIISPASSLDMIGDIKTTDDLIIKIGHNFSPEKSEYVIDCTGLIIMPGLIDMHLHLGDLFDINKNPIKKAACDGITLGLSPGAGNTYMAPALLGAEIDRGAAINAGIYLGASSVLGSSLDKEEIIELFHNKLDDKTKYEKLSHNTIVNRTANMTIGIKEHMGHFILKDQCIDDIFEITSNSGLLFMSHTQDPAHSKHLVELSKGRPLHLGHANAAGCGTHGDGFNSFKQILNLIDGDIITAEFVTSMLLPCRGRRDGLLMDIRAREEALKALSDKKVKILVSDGQSGATMKGFGNTSDNLPAIFYLAKEGILDLSSSIALMTSNPAALLTKRTNNPVFKEKFGLLAPLAYANITVADPVCERAVYTIVNGYISSFDGNIINKGACHGYWVHHGGITKDTSVGFLPIYD